MVNNTAKHFAALGSEVTLTLTVHSYPAATFVWSKSDVNTDDAASEPLNIDDQYQSSLVIYSVEARHYGEYSVTVTSGNTGLSRIFTVKLQQRGKIIHQLYNLLLSITYLQNITILLNTSNLLVQFLKSSCRTKF